MKQGSADDPFADDPDGGPETDAAGTADAADPSQSDAARSSSLGEDPASARSSSGGQPARQSLPYIHSRDGVKDGRTQRPVFLREHVEAGIDDLVAEMEQELGEDVYKTDVTEAAMVVAQEHPELVLETLEEWGYGWD